ncbi:AraC family transcriptional regulator [Escherichia coli]|nr:AraC family transcriptional regulator [Escherichia coli]
MYEFSSPQAFSRAFRQQFKVSPVQYRNAMPGYAVCPARIVRTTPCTKFRMIEIAEGNHPSVPNLKMPVNLGMDFIHTQSGDHFIYNRNLF